MFGFMSMMAANQGGVSPMFGNLFALIMVIALRDMIWKAIALWKSGRNNQLVWFIFILVFNTAGILPILYLLFFQKEEKVVVKVLEKEIEPIKSIAKRIAPKKVVKKIVKKSK